MTNTIEDKLATFEAHVEATRDAISNDAAEFLVKALSGDLDLPDAVLALGELFARVEELGISKGTIVGTVEALWGPAEATDAVAA